MKALTITATERRKSTIKYAAILNGCKSLTRVLFSTKVSTAVAVVVIAAMYRHTVTAVDTIEAQRAVAIDCLCGLPWLMAGAFRSSRKPSKKGGDR